MNGCGSGGGKRGVCTHLEGSCVVAITTTATAFLPLTALLSLFTLRKTKGHTRQAAGNTFIRRCRRGRGYVVVKQVYSRTVRACRRTVRACVRACVHMRVRVKGWWYLSRDFRYEGLEQGADQQQPSTSATHQRTAPWQSPSQLRMGRYARALLRCTAMA